MNPKRKQGTTEKVLAWLRTVKRSPNLPDVLEEAAAEKIIINKFQINLGLLSLPFFSFHPSSIIRPTNRVNLSFLSEPLDLSTRHHRGDRDAEHDDDHMNSVGREPVHVQDPVCDTAENEIAGARLISDSRNGFDSDVNRQTERDRWRADQAIARVRQPRLFRAAFQYNPSSFDGFQRHSIGSLSSITCRFCKAYLFSEDPKAMCCSNGRVGVGMNEWVTRMWIGLILTVLFLYCKSVLIDG